MGVEGDSFHERGGGGGELTAFMGGSDTFHGRVSDSFQGRGEGSDGFHREGGGGG